MCTVAVIKPQLMAPCTASGKNPMRSTISTNTWPLGMLLGALLFQGCAHDVSSSPIPTTPLPTHSTSTLAFEAQAEAKSLRAALAAERIKFAKQAADIRSTQAKMASLKARELEHTEKISQLKTELATLKSERDKLRVEVTQLRAKTASAPQVLQLVTQMRTMETSLNGLNESLETLSEDISTLREEVEGQKVVVQPTAPSSSQSAATHHMNGTDLIIVKPGDSLWALSQTYGTSVPELKQLNGLTQDTIVVGQFLKIPAIDTLDSEELVNLPHTKDKLTP